AVINKYYGKMEEWLRSTIKSQHNDLKEMQSLIQLGLNHPATWNHAKIIVADDKRVIAGGHNLWSKDYFGRAPIHDVSGLFEGPAALAARQFCDKLWEHTIHPMSFYNGVFKRGPVIRHRDTDAPPPPPKGKVEMLSLGRLGRGL